MKKSLSLLLVLALILSMFALVGCGESGDDGTGDAADLSLAIVVAGQFGDASFNDSSKVGGQQIEEDFGAAVTYVECKNEDFVQNLMNAADFNDIVVAVGWEFYEIPEVCEAYPDVKFIWIDNATEEPIDNLLNIIYAQNEGSFLAGYVAAKMSTSGVIGAVGGEDSATINDFLVGYKQGAEYANPDVKVEFNYAGTYDDPSKGKELALALNSKGADVVFQVAGDTGMGVFEAAQENNFYAIGVDQDQKVTAPTYDEYIICSMLKQVGKSIYDTVAAYINDGTFEGGSTWVADMTAGYIGLAYGDENSTQQVSDEIKAEVEELTGKIVSGEIVVDTTR